MNYEDSSGLCRLLAGLFIVFGTLGMIMSFLFLSSSSFDSITAGTSGFVAGAVLVGSGLISLAMLSAPRNRRAQD